MQGLACVGNFEVHIGGYNLIPLLKGEVKENPRKGLLYWSDDGDLLALRVGMYKVHFLEQLAEGFEAWQEPFVELRLPKLFNVRRDPFERADKDSKMFYQKWVADHLWALVPAQAIVALFVEGRVDVDSVEGKKTTVQRVSDRRILSLYTRPFTLTLGIRHLLPYTGSSSVTKKLSPTA